MNQTTDYLAPFSLWVCVRRHYRGDGTLFVEPAWVGKGAHTGLAMFVSRVHAHVYAALRNRHHDSDDSNNWQCAPLQAFGLLEHIRKVGGRLNCELVFGFATDAAGALVIADGAPRVRFLEVSFEVGDDIDDTTFGFNQWAFEFMRTEWHGIGAASLEATFDRIDAMSDVALACLLEPVLSDMVPVRDVPDVGHWAVFDPDAGRWVGAPICVPEHALKLH